MLAKRTPKPPVDPKPRTELSRASDASESPQVSDATRTPSSAHTYEDRVAFHQAFAGVRPLGAVPAKGGAQRRVPKTRRASVEAERLAAEEAARASLDRLVGGGVEFVVSRSDGVEGRRRSASPRTVRMLREGRLPPKASLDLHGLTRQEARPKIRAFVREAHRRGHRTIAIVHGKGSHSEGGIGVLCDVVVEVLSRGGAAPLVDAFATAPAPLGGDGVMLVQLH